MRLAGRLALELLRGEGLTPDRIAGIAKSSTSAVRLWMRGSDIPAGAAIRMIIAARVLNGLKTAKSSASSDGTAEIAAFARGWLAAHSRESRRAKG